MLKGSAAREMAAYLRTQDTTTIARKNMAHLTLNSKMTATRCAQDDCQMGASLQGIAQHGRRKSLVACSLAGLPESFNEFGNGFLLRCLCL